MNPQALKDLEIYILASFDVTPEEFLNASDSFSSLITLVSERSGKGEKEVRDLLNSVIGSNPSIKE